MNAVATVATVPSFDAAPQTEFAPSLDVVGSEARSIDALPIATLAAGVDADTDGIHSSGGSWSLPVARPVVDAERSDGVSGRPADIVSGHALRPTPSDVTASATAYGQLQPQQQPVRHSAGQIPALQPPAEPNDPFGSMAMGGASAEPPPTNSWARMQGEPPPPAPMAPPATPFAAHHSALPTAAPPVPVVDPWGAPPPAAPAQQPPLELPLGADDWIPTSSERGKGRRRARYKASIANRLHHSSGGHHPAPPPGRGGRDCSLGFNEVCLNSDGSIMSRDQIVRERQRLGLCTTCVDRPTRCFEQRSGRTGRMSRIVNRSKALVPRNEAGVVQEGTCLRCLGRGTAVDDVTDLGRTAGRQSGGRAEQAKKQAQERIFPQSTGAPPSSSPGVAVYCVTVPDGVRPGATFPARVGRKVLTVQCPSGAGPGTRLQITVDDKEETPSSLSRGIQGPQEKMLVFQAVVPRNTRPGHAFRAHVEGKSILVPCPLNAAPGSSILFRLPATLLDN